MNHQRVFISKLLQKTFPALNYTSFNFAATAAPKIYTHVVECRQRWFLQSPSPSPLLSNAQAMTTASSSTVWQTSKRCYSKFVSSNYPQHPKKSSSQTPLPPPMCEEKAMELVMSLKEAERASLQCALEKFNATQLKNGYEDRLASTQWRPRFWKKTIVPQHLRNVNPTGEFCKFPDDWLEKISEKAPPPAKKDIHKIFFVNAVPFVAFGFLDNFIMIVAGDYINATVGTFMSLSTMAAAGLGNTISDVLGLGTAVYVERLCSFMGLRPPDLVPAQMEMKQTRQAAMIGRILGIVIGCFLGMTPLLFLDAD